MVGSSIDSKLEVRKQIELSPGSRYFLLDLDGVEGAAKGDAVRVLASACKALPRPDNRASQATFDVDGVGGTPAVILLSCSRPPTAISLDGEAMSDFTHDAAEKLLWVRFENGAKPRELTVRFE